MGWDGTQADMIMPSLLYSPTPWRPKALCAVCVQSLRRSCLCFWTAAGSGVCSKIRLEELRRCQGCRDIRNRTMESGRKKKKKEKKERKHTRKQLKLSPEFGVAVLATEAWWMEDQVVGHQSLHWVDRLLTWWTHFLLSLKAEGLNT